MFTPDISIPALRAMRERFADRAYRKYGFVDAYNPTLNWFDIDVVGIDVGIVLLSAEDLLNGNVWRWFMATKPYRTRWIWQASVILQQRNLQTSRTTATPKRKSVHLASHPPAIINHQLQRVPLEGFCVP
jgi:hypothetical protein